MYSCGTVNLLYLYKLVKYVLVCTGTGSDILYWYVSNSHETSPINLQKTRIYWRAFHCTYESQQGHKAVKQTRAKFARALRRPASLLLGKLTLRVNKRLLQSPGKAVKHNGDLRRADGQVGLARFVAVIIFGWVSLKIAIGTEQRCAKTVVECFLAGIPVGGAVFRGQKVRL